MTREEKEQFIQSLKEFCVACLIEDKEVVEIIKAVEQEFEEIDFVQEHKKVEFIAYIPENATISRPLTRYDLLCMSAVHSLMLEVENTDEYIIISPRQVFSFIGGGDRFNEAEKKKIIDSLDTLRKAFVTLSNGDESCLLMAEKIAAEYDGNEIAVYKIHPRDVLFTRWLNYKYENGGQI